jgi:hypothetical protein
MSVLALASSLGHHRVVSFKFSCHVVSPLPVHQCGKQIFRNCIIVEFLLIHSNDWHCSFWCQRTSAMAAATSAIVDAF